MVKTTKKLRPIKLVAGDIWLEMANKYGLRDV